MSVVSWRAGHTLAGTHGVKRREIPATSTAFFKFTGNPVKLYLSNLPFLYKVKVQKPTQLLRLGLDENERSNIWCAV